MGKQPALFSISKAARAAENPVTTWDRLVLFAGMIVRKPAALLLLLAGPPAAVHFCPSRLLKSDNVSLRGGGQKCTFRPPFSRLIHEDQSAQERAVFGTADGTIVGRAVERIPMGKRVFFTAFWAGNAPQLQVVERLRLPLKCQGGRFRQLFCGS